MGIVEVFKEAKFEMFYFSLGIALMSFSPFIPQLTPLLFWGGALLASLGWIAFGFKVKALIASSRIELLERMIEDEVKRNTERPQKESQ